MKFSRPISSKVLLVPVLLVAVLLVLAGCTSTATQGHQPLSEKQRQRLGTVLVEANYRAQDSTSGITSDKAMGAAKGAGSAAGQWMVASLDSGDGLTALVGLLLTPVVALAGGIAGGVIPAQRPRHGEQTPPVAEVDHVLLGPVPAVCDHGIEITVAVEVTEMDRCRT